MELARRRRVGAGVGLVLAAAVMVLVVGGFDQKVVSPSTSSSTTSRKLLQHGMRPERMGDECSKADIVVHQGATGPLPNGIPTYTVEILNSCAAGYSIANIHVSCGWFSSARMINPKIFKRLAYDDCLVNNGAPLPSGRIISFRYATTFPYALSVTSATCI